MAQNISVPGGAHGAPLVFNVSGSSLVNEIAGFAAALNNAAQSGSLTINNLTAGTSTIAGAHALAIHADSTPSSNTTLNTIYSGGTSSTYTLSSGSEFTAVAVGDATTVFGSAAGKDTVFGGASFTFKAGGASDDVAFTTGTNSFEGDGFKGATITAGTGYDTITTGSGNATVFGGAGLSLINLDDDSTQGAFADEVYLGSGGHSTVNAFGYNDVVVTASDGQAIVGADSLGAGATLLVGLQSTDNVITAGSATTTVFDSVGGNSIFGGSGTLVFVGGAGTSTVADSIVGAQGTTVIFGAASDSVTFSSDTTGAVMSAIAGGGNETLNGANASGGFNFYGTTDTTSAVTVIGGSGYNTYQTGSGTEAIVGGTGTNNFYLNEGGAGTSITIFDFGGADSVTFGTAADSASLSTGVSSGGNYTLTLADGTSVEFIGITSLSGHT